MNYGAIQKACTGPFKKHVHSEGGWGYFKSARKWKRGEWSSVFAQKNSACTVIRKCGKIYACDVV